MTNCIYAVKDGLALLRGSAASLLNEKTMWPQLRIQIFSLLKVHPQVWPEVRGVIQTRALKLENPDTAYACEEFINFIL